MTDKDTGGSPKAPAGREKPPLRLLPLIIVVGLSLVSAVLRLPMWFTLLLLFIGPAFVFLSRLLAVKHPRDPKKAWLQLMSSYRMLKSAHAALKVSPSDADARKRFSKLLDECLALLNSRSDSDWGSDSGYVAKVRNGIVAMTASVPASGGSPAPAPSGEIGQLADLRKQGLLSESEFQAFSERFKVLAAEKACGILEAIAGLRLQCNQGTMTERDYHAALWTLLERHDRGDSDATPKPATPA